jgi:glycosyltransferase involved in cell wall biosynthesis
MGKDVWIVNPYGSLPAESWATYRSTMLARCLAEHGYAVTQFISNFEHRSKTFRDQPGGPIAAEGYRIEIVPSTAYGSHVSLDRIRYERTFARNVLSLGRQRSLPDFLVLAEPALFYYDILLALLTQNRRPALVLDVIDIWPELFELVIPRALRPLSGALLSPLYWWRKRLYRRADAVVAVAQDYLSIATPLVANRSVPLEVVYWSYDDRKEAALLDAPAGLESPVHALVARKQPGEIWVLYAGTLGENYDIDAVIELPRRLPQRLREKVAVTVVVAGDGPLASRCRDRADANFVFVGRLGAADLALLSRHADIALSTYRGKSTVAMPIKAFDYLRHGLPIVNSLGRDLGALVLEHEVGINYEPDVPSSLPSAVERLASDHELRRRMSANARRLAAAFAPERQYPKFVRVLETLAQRRASTQWPVRGNS